MNLSELSLPWKIVFFAVSVFFIMALICFIAQWVERVVCGEEFECYHYGSDAGKCSEQCYSCSQTESERSKPAKR